MSADAGHFIRGWLITTLLITAMVVSVNAAIDPYLLFNMPRVRWFNDRKPGFEHQERLMKAYEVVRAAPNGLILGTSRVAIGLDPAHAAWPAKARPVYNLGVVDADPFTSFRYLQHVLAHRDVAVVVLGLDFEDFLVGQRRDPSAPLPYESYLSVDRDGRPAPDRRWHYLRDLTESTLSLEALADSVATVRASMRGETLDVTASGTLSEAGFRREMAELGAPVLFTRRDLDYFRRYHGRTFPESNAGQADAPALVDLRAIIELCRARGIQLELFAQPVHADLLETLDLLGAWSAYEAWKRELVEVSHSGASGVDPAVRVWDFGGYDQFSAEPFPESTELSARLRWFWEPTYYTRALGNIILTRIFGGRDTGYGVVLTGDTIEARLADVRERRNAYRASHPEAVRRVREIYDSASK